MYIRPIVATLTFKSIVGHFGHSLPLPELDKADTTLMLMWQK